MTILVIGANGMLGHRAYLGLRAGFSVVGLSRTSQGLPDELARDLMVRPYDLNDFASLVPHLDAVKPSVVINCAGIIKQRSSTSDSEFIAVNSLLPHRLADYCAVAGARLIQVSTDCVFSGRQGPYRIEDTPDAEDTYGRSKLLGEIASPHGVTFRTSMIGPELGQKSSLLEWFLAQRGNVRGFTRALFSGLTTIEIARFFGLILSQHRELSGIWQLAADPISKFDLLQQVGRVYGRKDIVLEPFADFHCDRRLNATPLFERIGYRPPSWPEMIDEMHRVHASGLYGTGGRH